MMKRFLILFLLAIWFFLFWSDFGVAYSEPSTQVNMYAYADAYYVEPSQDSNYLTFSGTMDNSSSTWITHNTSSVNAIYGGNSAKIDLIYESLIPPPGPGDAQILWGTNISYSLRGLSEGGSYIDIANYTITKELTGNSSELFDYIISTSFNFIYGVPYEIESILNMDASGGKSGSYLSSTWEDSLIFLGGTEGSMGIAELSVGLSGSLFSEKYEQTGGMLGGPWSVNHCTIDFSSTISSGGFNLPNGAWMEITSGMKYPVHIPEPNSLLLSITATFGILGSRKLFGSKQ